MANKQALRELQDRLAERLQAARERESSVSWLAVEAAGRGFLLPLAQAGEIFPLVPMTQVPHTRPWFLGVANLRGGLYGVVDLARFLALRGAPPEPLREPPRLVALNPALEVNAALQVDRLSGLRGPDQLEQEAPGAAARPRFAGPLFRDAAGRRWQELDLAALAHDGLFLDIVN